MTFHRRTFLKQLGFGAAGLGLVSCIPDSMAAQQLMHRKLPRGTPEAQGISSGAILAFLNAVAQSKHEVHSLMIVRHGQVVAEGWWSPYRPESPQMMYSLSKSFTSTAVGFAAAERRLTVEDRVTSFFPNEVPENVSQNLTALKVKHLLTMSVGHAEDSTGSLWGEENWVKKFLSLPIKNEPGTAFLYNSGATYMLSAIVQKLTGQRVIDYLKPRLFQPLDIEGVTWEMCPRGINTGGWGLKIQTEGLARFGQLYLQKGVWKEKQILPAAWVEEATSFKIQQPAATNLVEVKKRSDWHQGYGYQFWRCRHNAYRGDGAFGQYTIVMPEQDAVVAITSETSSMQGVLDLVWEHILPAMKDQPLAADKGSQQELKQRLSSLQLAPARSQASSPIVENISGKVFSLESNSLCAQAVSFRFHKDSCLFTLRDDKREHAIKCGIEKWVRDETSMPGTPPKLTSGDLGPNQKIAASGAWKDPNTFEMTWRFYETPHHDTATCRFEGDQVKIEFLNSLTAMSPSRKDKRPVLQGRTGNGKA